MRHSNNTTIPCQARAYNRNGLIGVLSRRTLDADGHVYEVKHQGNRLLKAYISTINPTGYFHTLCDDKNVVHIAQIGNSVGRQFIPFEPEQIEKIERR